MYVRKSRRLVLVPNTDELSSYHTRDRTPYGPTRGVVRSDYDSTFSGAAIPGARAPDRAHLRNGFNKSLGRQVRRPSK